VQGCTNAAGAGCAGAADANGNVTSIQPPGRSAHVFAYTAVDLEETYTPPLLPEGVTPTVYRYNLDRQLTAIERPDGRDVSLLYDTGGRLSQVSAPVGITGYSYDAVTGNLASISAPGGVNLAYTWDGFLPLSETMTGEVTGTVTRGYNADLQVTSLAVDGQAVAYGYDADGLLTQAGALGLARDPGNGLLTGTTLGNLTTALTYNAFGELASETATRAGTALYQASYTRDGIGRIAEKHETAAGTPTTWGYSYDDAGRLTGVLRNGAPYKSQIVDTHILRSGGSRIVDAHILHSGTYLHLRGFISGASLMPGRGPLVKLGHPQNPSGQVWMHLLE